MQQTAKYLINRQSPKVFGALNYMQVKQENINKNLPVFRNAKRRKTINESVKNNTDDKNGGVQAWVNMQTSGSNSKRYNSLGAYSNIKKR